MKSTNKLLVVTLSIAAAMTAMAYAQDTSAQQGAPNHGGMMGHGILAPGMMGPGMMGPGMMGHDGGSSGMMHSGAFDPAMCAAMAGHIGGRLAYLKAELKITDPWG